MSDPVTGWRGRANSAALWNVTVPELLQAFKRFPLPVVFCVLFAAYTLIGKNVLFGHQQNLTTYLEWEFAAGFLWTLITAIWAESGDKSRWEYFLATLSGIGIIALLLTGTKLLHTSPILLLLTLLLVLSLSAHHTQQEQNDHFWQFNRRLWFGASLSVMGVLAMVSIPLAIAGSIEYLFVLRLHDGVYSKIFFLSLGLLAPLFWLTMIPKIFNASFEPESRRVPIRGASELLVSYVLVPAMLFYTLVLYRYSYKIWHDGAVPPGRLGLVVLVFACLGITTYLMSYPLRRTGGLLVRFYWRSWFILSSIPAGLLGIAVVIRIKAYGLTEARYVLALLVVWLLGLFIAFVLLRVKDLRVIPATLAALLILGSFGPPGATALSLRSQISQLDKLLEANGQLIDGRFVSSPSPPRSLNSEDAARVNSILNYLDERGGLSRLEPWFQSYKSSPFTAKSISNNDEMSRRTLITKLSAIMGAPRSPVGAANTRTVVFYARGPALIALKHTKRLAGPVNLSLKPNGSKTSVRVAPGTGRDLLVTLNEREVIITDKRGRTARFDLSAVASKIAWFEDEKALVPAVTSPRIILPVMSGAGENKLDLRLVMTSLQGQRARDGRYAFKQISCWILIYKRMP